MQVPKVVKPVKQNDKNDCTLPKIGKIEENTPPKINNIPISQNNKDKVRVHTELDQDNLLTNADPIR